MNNNSGKDIKRGLILITYAIVLYLALKNISIFLTFFKFVYNIMVPFVYAFAIAYLLNKPYVFFKDTAFAKMGKDGTKTAKLRKPLALLCAYIVGVALIIFLLGILIPELLKSGDQLVSNFSTYTESFENFLTDMMKRFNIDIDRNGSLFQTINDLTAKVTGGNLADLVSNVVKSFLPTVFDFTKNLTTAVYNWLISIVISVYMLVSKENLLLQCRKLVYACVPKRMLDSVIEAATLSHKMLGRFIYGRIIDSAIIGVICYIGMLVFRFDYPLIISVIVGVTNVIPFFGPFIGAIPSCILLLMIDPMQAVWFAVFVFILQQIDGNIIGAKILGATIGISDFWIMFSILLGGGLFGMVGMILGCPIFAVIYILIGRYVNRKVEVNGYAQQAEKSFSQIVKEKNRPNDKS